MQAEQRAPYRICGHCKDHGVVSTDDDCLLYLLTVVGDTSNFLASAQVDTRGLRVEQAPPLRGLAIPY